jgi:hypothetical protein
VSETIFQPRAKKTWVHSLLIAALVALAVSLFGAVGMVRAVNADMNSVKREECIKMSHVVVDYLKVSNQLHLIKHIDNIAAFHDEAYYKQVNRAIFPDWNHNIWQVKKPTGAIYNEQSKWFLDSDLPAKLKWESSIYELERLCGKKWFNGDSVRNGLRGHLSPKYKISTYRPAQSVDH